MYGKMNAKRHSLIIVLLLAGLAFATSIDYRNVVDNFSFEDGLADDSLRPRYWQIGFPDEAPIDYLGEFTLDSTISASGDFSLHVVPHCASSESYFLTQFLDAPTFDLDGKTVSFSTKIRCDSPTGVIAVLLAYNPESTDSFIGAPAVGGVILSPVSTDTGFVAYSDSFTATGPAAVIAVLLLLDGSSDGAWFDDIEVVFDVAETGHGPDTSDVPDPLDGAYRDFFIGIVSEMPRNNSEKAAEDLPSEIAEVGDITNIFAHIKWNALTGQPMLKGHDQQLQWAEGARDFGLARMLSLDFTHNDASTIGEINPMPDGTPVDSLSAEVRMAYIDELVALIDEIDPIIVSVGIETNFLYDVRPDQWDNYKLLLEEIHTALAGYPDIHITTYFVLTLMVTNTGAFFPGMRSAWEEIIPYCGSVAFSFYPNVADTLFYNDSMFTSVKTLAPDKPLLIPEFGCRSGSATGFSEDIQYGFLKKVVANLASTSPSPLAVIWYQMADNQYLGTPFWFSSSFSTIGLKDFAGTPKKTHVAFRKMLDNVHIIEEEAVSLPIFTISAYPNPFNSAVTIALDAPVGAIHELPLRIEIYDVNGRLVAELIPPDPPLTRGEEEKSPLSGGRTVRRQDLGGLVWTPNKSLPSGVYLVRASVEGRGDLDPTEKTATKRVVYLK